MTQTGGVGNIYQAYDPKIISAAGKEIDVDAFETYFKSQKAVLEKEINNLDNRIKTVTGGDISRITAMSDDLSNLKKLQYINNLAIALTFSVSGNPVRDARYFERYKSKVKEYNNDKEVCHIISELPELERQLKKKVISVPNADRKSYPSHPAHDEPYYVDLDISYSPKKLAELERKVDDLKHAKEDALRRHGLREPIFTETDLHFVCLCLYDIQFSGLKDKKLIYSKLDRFFTYIQKVWYKSAANQNSDIS